MNADGSSSASRNLIRAGTFHRLQPSTTLHVNKVCLLLNKEGAGWGLSDAKTNWVSILNTSIPPCLWRFTLKQVFYTDLYRFDKEKWKRYPLCTELKICKYCMEFSCFIFLNVSMLFLAKQLCLTFCSSSFDCLDTNGTGTKAPRYPPLTWFFFQLKSHFFVVLERMLFKCFFFSFVRLMYPLLLWLRQKNGTAQKDPELVTLSNRKAVVISHC